MGNAGGVFQAGEACVFSIALAADCFNKLGWRSVAEAAVWPLFVVLSFPSGNLDACVEQVSEPTYTQALFSGPSMEAFYVCVLGRQNSSLPRGAFTDSEHNSSYNLPRTC